MRLLIPALTAVAGLLFAAAAVAQPAQPAGQTNPGLLNALKVLAGTPAAAKAPEPGGGLDFDLDGVPNHLDCHDFDPYTYPGAPELCDGRDNDCNGLVEGGGIATLWDANGVPSDVTAQMNVTTFTVPWANKLALCAGTWPRIDLQTYADVVGYGGASQVIIDGAGLSFCIFANASSGHEIRGLSTRNCGNGITSLGGLIIDDVILSGAWRGLLSTEVGYAYNTIEIRNSQFVPATAPIYTGCSPATAENCLRNQAILHHLGMLTMDNVVIQGMGNPTPHVDSVVALHDVDAILTNVSFFDNQASGASALWITSGTLAASHTVFDNNAAVNRAAVWLQSSTGSFTDVEFTRNVTTPGDATGHRAAVFITGSGSADFVDTLFGAGSMKNDPADVRCGATSTSFTWQTLRTVFCTAAWCGAPDTQ